MRTIRVRAGRATWAATILVSLAGGNLCTGQTQPATGPIRTSEPIPPQTLDAMYRRELGPLYRAQDAARLPAAHQLIERYFATNSAGDRKMIARQIEQSGIDANVLGRITRLRMDWPQLQ